MEPEVVAIAPSSMFDISTLSLEGLCLLYVFGINYVHTPDAELGDIAARELVHRGVLTLLSDDNLEWDLDADTREELACVFEEHHMLRTFYTITTPDSDEDSVAS